MTVEIRKRTVGAAVVAQLSGDLDSRSAPAAQERLVALVAPAGRLLVDLTDVPYMSSAGLRTMLLVYRQAQCVDTAVALVGLNAELRSVLAATGFLDFFVVRDSVRDGLEALGAGGDVREGAQP